MIINHNIRHYLIRLRLFQFQWIFFWHFCSILIVHIDSHPRDFQDFGGDITTPNAVHYTFGLKVNRANHSKAFYDSVDRPNRLVVSNQLKNQIKFVLNLGLHVKNESVDRFIVESFNIFNPDPVYVFVLPDQSNRTLVFRRSNFTDISFPNTTSIQAVQNLLRSSKFAHLFPSDEERLSKQMALDQRFFAKYKEFMFNNNDLYEAESLKIIEENVRTEKNFVKFMNKLNDDIEGDVESMEDDSKQVAASVKHQSTNF